MFFALNVTVKDCTLQDSLDQFVKAELLDADNAFFCEKCNEKVTAPLCSFCGSHCQVPLETGLGGLSEVVKQCHVPPSIP